MRRALLLFIQAAVVAGCCALCAFLWGRVLGEKVAVPRPSAAPVRTTTTRVPLVPSLLQHPPHRRKARTLPVSPAPTSQFVSAGSTASGSQPASHNTPNPSPKPTRGANPNPPAATPTPPAEPYTPPPSGTTTPATAVATQPQRVTAVASGSPSGTGSGNSTGGGGKNGNGGDKDDNGGRGRDRDNDGKRGDKENDGNGGDKDDNGGCGNENGRRTVPSAVLAQAAASSAVTGDPSSGTGLQASPAPAGGRGHAGSQTKHDDNGAPVSLTATGTGASTTVPATNASHDSSQGGGQDSGQGDSGQGGGGQNGGGGHGGGRGPHH